ncbi:hypothetical protein [Amedibacillus sp. YH-ame10]
MKKLLLRYTFMLILCTVFFCTGCTKQAISQDKALRLLQEHLNLKESDSLSYYITDNDEAYFIKIVIKDYRALGGSGSAGTYHIWKKSGKVQEDI